MPRRVRPSVRQMKNGDQHLLVHGGERRGAPDLVSE
jgi:hypothetical protein